MVIMVIIVIGNFAIVIAYDKFYKNSEVVYLVKLQTIPYKNSLVTALIQACCRPEQLPTGL